MSSLILAGAPFDKGNLFSRPALDAGPINTENFSGMIHGIDGGDFNGQPPETLLYDGGTIPTAGTASYDPNKVYGPEDLIADVLRVLDGY